MRRSALITAWSGIIGVLLLSVHLFAWPAYARWSNNRIGEEMGYGNCDVCRDYYSWKPAHQVDLTENTASFLLCQECWDTMSPAERAEIYVIEAEHFAEHMPNYFDDRRLRPLGEPSLLIDEFDNWTDYIENVRRAVLEDRGGRTLKPFLDRKRKTVYVNRC